MLNVQLSKLSPLDLCLCFRNTERIGAIQPNWVITRVSNAGVSRGTQVIMPCTAFWRLPKTVINSTQSRLPNSNRINIVAAAQILSVWIQWNTSAPTQSQRSMKRRVRISLVQNLDIANNWHKEYKLPQSWTSTAAARVQSYRSIKLQKSQILELSRTSVTSLYAETLRASLFPLIEEHLMNCMIIAISARMPVTVSVL